MAEIDNRRDSRRIPFVYTVHYGRQIPGDTISLIVDLSGGGLFIKTRNCLPVGTWLYMNIRVDDSVYPAEGVVAWTRDESLTYMHRPTNGMGIRFKKPDQRLASLYEETAHATLQAEQIESIEPIEIL